MSRLTRREFIKLSGAAGAGLTAWPLAEAAAQGPAKSARPNILIFLTDDHGQWAQHAYGNSELVTPNLDRLALRGTRMTQAFTTCPVCSPARASFFTGRMPSQHGIHDWLDYKLFAETDLLAGQTLISELLRSAGYQTGLIGKWHCGLERGPHPGFDRWFGYWLGQHPHRGVQHFSDQEHLVVEEGQQSPLLTRRAIEFIQEHQRNRDADGKPFFLFISYVDTHNPHKNAPDDLVKQYHSATFRDIPNETFPPCHGEALNPVNKNPAIERKKRMEYYGAASSVDREVGKVLAALEATGQMDNTLIIYTGDHGLNCGQHGMWEKGNATIPQNFLEESIRVACTWSWPAGGIRQHAACAELVNHCDLWRTLLEIGGATPTEPTAARINSPGRSYLSQLRGQTVHDWRETLISEYGNARMARTQRYKLIRRYPYAGVTFPDELYDLREDPRETANRHNDPALRDIVQQLAAQLDEFFAKYTVPGHSGLDLEHQPVFTTASPWLVAARKHDKHP